MKLILLKSQYYTVIVGNKHNGVQQNKYKLLQIFVGWNIRWGMTTYVSGYTVVLLLPIQWAQWDLYQYTVPISNCMSLMGREEHMLVVVHVMKCVGWDIFVSLYRGMYVLTQRFPMVAKQVSSVMMVK